MDRSLQSTLLIVLTVTGWSRWMWINRFEFLKFKKEEDIKKKSGNIIVIYNIKNNYNCSRVKKFKKLFNLIFILIN